MKNMSLKRKYIYLIIILITIFISSFPISGQAAYADETNKTEDEIESEIKDNVNDQLGGLDMSAIEQLLAKLTNGEFGFFGNSSFIDKVKKIISGEFSENQSSVFSAILNLFFEDLLNFIPLIATIIAIAIIASMIDNLRSNKSSGIGSIVHFVTYGVIVLILFSSVIEMLNLTTTTLGLMKGQMDAIFPILLTLLTALGGTASVGVYQPTVAFLSGSILQIFNYVLMPIFIFSMVFSVISNISDNVKLEKFSSFFSSVFKWTIGLIFTIFMGFASIQGITAGSFDGVSIKAAKFAIRSYIPILGGYLSEGFNLIMASSVLIKNAIGAAGLMLLFATIIIPIIKLVLFMFSLKLMAAIIEPLSDSKIANFIHSLSKSIVMLIVLIIGVAFMYLILTGLIMCTANVL